MEKNYHLFLSYSHNDTWIMRSVAYRLHMYGVRIWTDTEIEAGEKWEARIERELADTSSFAVIITPNAIESKYVERECQLAVSLHENNSERRIMVLKAGECEIPGYLKEFEYIDIQHVEHSKSTHHFENEMRRLAGKLRSKNNPEILSNQFDPSKTGALFWVAKDFYYALDLLEGDEQLFLTLSNDVNFIVWWLKQGLHHAEQLAIPENRFHMLKSLAKSIEETDLTNKTRRLGLARQIREELRGIAVIFEDFQIGFERWPNGMPPMPQGIKSSSSKSSTNWD